MALNYDAHAGKNIAEPCVFSDCDEGNFRCNTTNPECVPLGDACDTLDDCTFGEDELNCEAFTQCDNGGTRVLGVEGAENVCLCPDRYNGTLCEIDQGENSHFSVVTIPNL